jgi:hypothetical protein
MRRLPQHTSTARWAAGWCLAIYIWISPASAEAAAATVIADRSNSTIAYAADELARFLQEASAMEVLRSGANAKDGQWVFRLDLDASMPPEEWSISSLPSGDQTVVRLTGRNPSTVLHAVYTLLEKLGICFDTTGPILPEKLDFDSLAGWATHVKPDVALRGVRQHLNFPMDISSYPLAEAKEYVRNLARLRMNFIVFHSYTGQFYSCPELKLRAGEYFYGQRHNIPAEDLFRENLRNRRVFCPPEVEAIYDRPEEKSLAAIDWLSELMREAKKCGFTLQFSFEPPGKNTEEGLAACRAILGSYPQIDILEIITPENGGHTAETLKRNLEIASCLQRKLGTHCPPLVLGVYETGPGFKEGLNYLRDRSPVDVGWSFLPAHGGRAVVDALQIAEFTSADWRRSVIYSWIEFDGLMFLQQNSVRGTQELLQLAKASLVGKTVPAVAFNHWRNAENRTSLRFASLACLDASLDPSTFYEGYARSLGIGSPESYRRLMDDLDDVDTFCRDHLFTIGFSFAACWTTPKGLAWTRTWKKEDLLEAIRRISAIRPLVAKCLVSTADRRGRHYLRFLDNRLRAGILHLRAIAPLLDLQTICDDEHPEALGIEEQKIARDKCDAAMAFAKEYMQVLAEEIDDRGGEGTLISYYHTVPAYIEHIRKLFLKECPQSAQPQPTSRPPAPGESSNPDQP